MFAKTKKLLGAIEDISEDLPSQNACIEVLASAILNFALHAPSEELIVDFIEQLRKKLRLGLSVTQEFRDVIASGSSGPLVTPNEPESCDSNCESCNKKPSEAKLERMVRRDYPGKASA